MRVPLTSDPVATARGSVTAALVYAPVSNLILDSVQESAR